MLTMNEWLTIFETQHKFRIYIGCDVKIAQTVGLDFSHQIHRSPICNYIKSSDDGFISCLKCKSVVEKKCNRKGEFSGYCINGCFELVSPIYYMKKHIATIYIGNLTPDKSYTKHKLEQSAKKYNLNQDDILNLLETIDDKVDMKYLQSIAKAINDAFISILNRQPTIPSDSAPPLVEMLLSYIHANPSSNIPLKNISLEYHVHEKYLGMLFKKHVGLSFAEYRNKFRLKRATELLIKSNRKIIDISLDLGYENVTYFNRLFFREYNISPSDYRKNYNNKESRTKSSIQTNTRKPS